MMNDVILKAEGYQVTFKFERYKDFQTPLRLTIVFVLDPRVGNVRIETLASPILVSDVERLADYLEQHIAALQKDPNSESYVFVPLDLQFQLQGLSGDVIPEEEGELTLQFLVNMGGQDDESSSVYLGGRTAIRVENVNSFIAAIRRLLAETVSS